MGYTVGELARLHAARHPYEDVGNSCLTGLANFAVADLDPDPICLENKVWQLVKLDFSEWTE